MAEQKSVEQLQAEQTAELAKMKAAYDAQIAENEALRAVLKDQNIAKTIEGSVTVVLKSTSGVESKKKVGIKAGHVKTHVIDLEQGINEIVDSAALLAAANGKVSDAQKSENPLLGKWSADEAKNYITHLVKIGYAGLEVTNA